MSNRAQRRQLKKEPMIVNNVDRRQFSYSKGIVSLMFTLRTDVPEELESFKELALTAIADIDKALANLAKNEKGSKK
jgi:hypothetical protein